MKKIIVPNYPPVKTETVIVQGGVDLTTSPLKMDPGSFMMCGNVWMEAGEDEAKRIAGYERFDGRTSPSYYETATEIEAQRDLINSVPGTGDILGGKKYKGTNYVFREDEYDGTARMFQESATGWVEVSTSTLNGNNGLTPNRFEFASFNWTGVDGADVLIWVNSANQCCSYDGTTITEMSSGVTVDAPTHIGIFQNRLFLSFDGGSWRCSDSSDHTDFTSTTALSHEKYTGENISGFRRMTQNAFLVTCPNSTYIIQGPGDSSWVWSEYNMSMGAAEWTTQGETDPVFLNGMNITTLSATNAYGDFQDASLSQKITPFLVERANSAVASLSCKTKSQYRLFFDDKKFLVLTFNGGSYRGATICEYPFQVTCTWSDITDGVETLYAGGDDGYVYQLDSGNTFDDAATTGYIRFPYNHCGTPMHDKEFLEMEILGNTPSGLSENTSLSLVAEYSYATADLPPAVERGIDSTASGGFWDIESQYGGFAFDAQPVGENMADLGGSGKNIGIFINFTSQYDPAFSISALLINYIQLGRLNNG